MKENNNYYNGEENSNGFDYYNTAPQTPQTAIIPVKKKHGKGGKIVALALCCSLLGGVAGAGGTIAYAKYFGEKQSVSANASDTPNKDGATTILTGSRSNSGVTETKVDSSKLMTASQVYEANVNSTVGITTSINTNFFGYQTTAAASGSGFILSKDGYILTNYHVIEGANSITVTDYKGDTYDAEIVGTDESNDIAVLKIEAKDLTPVVLGSSDDLSIGDQVVAIGNPLGELTFSLTSGIVSALDREITTENSTMMNLIQTDCAINSGNSGGALFNMYGEVVGITNAKYSSNSSNEASIDNIGFAIPIDSVRNIVTSIIEKGYATKPYIGVTIGDVSSDALAYGLPEGAAVQSVSKDSPAEKAGLEANDIITEVDGEKIKDSTDLTSKVRDSSAGDKIKLKVYRKGEYLDFTVTVDEKTTENETEEQTEEQKPSGGEQYQEYDFGGFPFGDMFGF